jgi:uncharacterized protein YlxW (UPF0749 family)
MKNIMKELKYFKELSSNEKVRERTDARISKLKEERDWFRAETLRLHKKCKDLEDNINKIKGSSLKDMKKPLDS